MWTFEEKYKEMHGTVAGRLGHRIQLLSESYKKDNEF